MKTSVLLAAALASLALVGAASAADPRDRLPAEIRDGGKLVVGTSPTYPPLEFKNPETMKLEGLDIDLTEEIGRRLGLEVVWAEQSFDQLINSLDTGRIHMGASGMTDIPTRREKTNFVDYFSTGSQIFTMPGVADDLKSATDVCGRPVAVNRNGIFLIRLKDFDKTACLDAGRPGIQYVLVDKTADARLQLVQRRAVAAVQGVDAIRFLNESKNSADKGRFRLIGEPIAVDHAGFGFSKKQPALRDAVADVVDAMIADGTYGRIFAKWEMPYAVMMKTLIDGEPRKP